MAAKIEAAAITIGLAVLVASVSQLSCGAREYKNAQNNSVADCYRFLESKDDDDPNKDKRYDPPPVRAQPQKPHRQDPRNDPHDEVHPGDHPINSPFDK